jgi:asparagine synthase (glutamine-hydrolysing)
MPGIIGFTNSKVLREENLRQLNKMSKKLCYGNFYLEKEYSDQSISVLEVNLNKAEDSLDLQDDVYIWIDGEIYNKSEFSSIGWVESDTEFLKLLYKKEGTLDFLSKKRWLLFWRNL